MITGGFFVQSNVVARSLIEAIDVMHLLNSRRELAEEFRLIEENTESSKFWHKYCSRDKIQKVVKERWLWFFNEDDELASSFCGARGNYLDLLGMSAHPSFGASFAAFMDAPEEESSIALNAMGSISHMSKFTIHLILYRIFEYGFLWVGPEIGLYKSERNVGPEPKLHKNLQKGLSALLSMVAMLGDRPKGNPFYPNFETYWPRQNFEE
jgi:hypothetical protein